MSTKESFPWIIAEDGGVSDRYATREEAESVLSDYSAGATVQYQAEPESDEDYALVCDAQHAANTFRLEGDL